MNLFEVAITKLLIQEGIAIKRGKWNKQRNQKAIREKALSNKSWIFNSTNHSIIQVNNLLYPAAGIKKKIIKICLYIKQKFKLTSF